MRNVHAPVWLGSVSRPTAGAFLTLFTLEASCRALLMSVIPLTVHGILKDAQLVSLVYLGVSFVGLVASLGIPSLVYMLKRRWVVTIGAAFMVAAACLFAMGGLVPTIAGLGCQIVGTACLEIPLNLYLMDHVPRQDMGRFEPKRLVFAGGMFIIGPWLGVFMASNIATWAPFLVVGTSAVLLIGYFWFLRITDAPAVTAKLKPPPNPVAFLPRFFSQPRLRLAWGLAIGRTGWWIMFFVYTPIYVTEMGFSQEKAAAVVSVGTAAMLLVPLWGHLGRKYGFRALLSTGYLLTGVVSIAVTVLGFMDLPWGVLALLVAAGASATVMDGAGNVPFLRAVHPFERDQMTSVFVTFRHVANIAAPGLLAAVLSFAALPAVFATGGLAMFGMAGLSRFLHKRM